MRDNGLDLNNYVFEKHEIDSLQFALSNSYYAYYIEEYEDIYIRVTDSIDKLKIALKEKEAAEWKEETKREADSLAKVYKAKNKDKDSLTFDLNKLVDDSFDEVDDALKEESIKELEELLDPISDKDFQ